MEEQIRVLELKSEKGMKVRLCNVGAAVLAIELPDGSDVLLGTGKPEQGLYPGPMFGAVLGRVAGRIKEGGYTYRGQSVRLSPNRGTYHCHGGWKGFDKRIFQVEEHASDCVVMTRLSPDGEEGYPGNLRVRLTFRLRGMRLITEQEAVSDRDTIVSMSNHLYFNLNGQERGNVENHLVRIRAEEMTEQDEECFDTGILKSVAGTVYDFRSFHRIGTVGYDHNFILTPGTEEDYAVQAYSPLTGHLLTMYTDMPAVQFYVADFKGTGTRGKGNRLYDERNGFCLVTQFPPNAMNTDIPLKPVLHAGESYFHRTVFAFDEFLNQE